VIARGVGGSTTLDWVGPTVGIPYAELEDALVPLFEGIAVPDLPTEIVIILLGTNDAIGYWEDSPVSPDEFSRNVELLTRRLLDRGAGRVVLVPPPPQHHAPREVRLRLFGYRAAIERLCRVMSSEWSADLPPVLCGPNLLDLLGPEDFEKDDVHPNEQGHRRIAEAVAETIEGLSRGRAPGRGRDRDSEPEALRSSSESSDSSELPDSPE